jgi:hypothetical protein
MGILLVIIGLELKTTGGASLLIPSYLLDGLKRKKEKKCLS